MVPTSDVSWAISHARCSRGALPSRANVAAAERGWLALTLLGLFAVQYALPGQAARYLLVAIYGAIAVAALARNRRHIWPALTAPFRGLPSSAAGPDRGPADPPSPAERLTLSGSPSR